MKKLFTLGALLLGLSLGASAQEKKGWLFYEGLSDETIANLNADATNWADNGHEDDGTIYNWKNAAKQSADAEWTANGQVIDELRGLKIDIGSNKDNSVHLQTVRANGQAGKLRLTRKNTKITFPKLANGQKVTIEGRSANGSATNRGIAAVQSHLVFQADESSPQYNGACIFVGNQVEGSEGTYKFVWKVVTDQTDSVDVQFQLTPDAGIDFNYFMIDNGDAPDVKEAQPVAYLYSGNLDDDYAYAFLSGSDKFAVTDINTAETTATADSLQTFQAIIVSPTIGADDAYLPTIKQAIAYVPVLNLNPYLYPAWGYGEVQQSESGMLGVVQADWAGFESFDLSEVEPIIELLADGNIVGVKLADYFANDQVLATAGDPADGITAMHIHNAKRNAYVLLPLPLESLAGANFDILPDLLPQVLQAVVDTKKEVTAVGTPVISANQQNGYTVVSLSATNSTAIFYTLDGSDPTTESTRYAEPITLTEPTTVKALAIGDGYTNSKVATKDIVIMVQAAAPSVSIAREAGKSTVTLTSASEGTSIYFSFNGITASADAQVYTEPIVLEEPATITAIAEGGDFLPSDPATRFIGIDGIDKTTIRLDTIAHFDANEADWFINDPETSNTATPKASAYYFWGSSAWNYYSSEIDHEETVKDSEGNDSIVYVYKIDPEALKVAYPLNENGWVLKSQGQALVGELQLSVVNTVGNGRANRYADEAIDLLTTPTKGAITFNGKSSGEPYTGRIETTGKLQGPFDVIVHCGNGNGSGMAEMEVQTSADGEAWTSLGQLKLASTQRYIKRTRLSYNESGAVYVRVAQTGGSTKAQVYDILVLNNGELSQLYSEDVMEGIQSQQPAGQVVRTEVFSLGGMRSQGALRGLQIVRKTYADGTVTTQKVVK